MNMKFEDLLEEIDSFGHFQILVLILACYPQAILPSHFLLTNFIGVVPPHHCDLRTLDNGTFTNLTEAQKLTVSIPVGEDGSPKSCEMFAEPQFQLLANGSNGTDLPTIPCPSGWVYDHSTFTSTMATEWDLVCDRQSQTRTSSTIFFLGVMFGAIFFGFIADKYGRKRSLLVAYITALVFGFSSAFANSYAFFVALRFLTAFGLSGMNLISGALSIEWVDVGHRAFNNVFVSLAWSVGNMLLAVTGFLIKDWRRLLLTVTAPLILTVFTWWGVPESARWLLTNGKLKRAQFYLDICAKRNKRKKLSFQLILQVCIMTTSVSKVAGIQMKDPYAKNTDRSAFLGDLITSSDMKTFEKQNKSNTYLDLIKTPKMRRLTFVTGVIWFGVSMTYYGISLNISKFGLNLSLMHFMYAAIEVPLRLLTFYFLNIIGRKWCQAGSLLMAGVCLTINIFVPKGLLILRTVVAIIGKGFSGASFQIVFLYTTELYPTVLRQKGLGYNSFICRFGATMVPLILLLENDYHLPQIIISFIAIVSGLLALTLPETLKEILPETIDDIEKTRINDDSSHTMDA